MDKSNWKDSAIGDIKITKVENGYVVDLFVKFRKKDPLTGNFSTQNQFVFFNSTDTSDFINECLCD